MDKEKNRFNVEEHTTLDGRIIDVFPISHRYIHNLEQQCKKQKEVIDKTIELINRMDEECEEEGCSFVNLIEVIKINDILKGEK